MTSSEPTTGKRVSAIVTVDLMAEVNGTSGKVGDTMTLDLTDLWIVRKSEPLAASMMPMKVEQVAGDLFRAIVERMEPQP